VGIGFTLVEIVLVQRMTLFIGRPVLTFATVLGGLLICSRIGAALSGRLVGDSPNAALRRIIPVLLVVLAVTSIAAPLIIESALGWPLPARIATTLALIAPLGIAMGMPFPVGLRAVQGSAAQLVPWAWGANGFFTVIGSVVAVMLGMTIGFTGALIIAGACYAVALGAGWSRAPQEADNVAAQASGQREARWAADHASAPESQVGQGPEGVPWTG
jgi:hypothetical protein